MLEAIEGGSSVTGSAESKGMDEGKETNDGESEVACGSCRCGSKMGEGSPRERKGRRSLEDWWRSAESDGESSNWIIPSEEKGWETGRGDEMARVGSERTGSEPRERGDGRETGGGARGMGVDEDGGETEEMREGADGEGEAKRGEGSVGGG